MAIIKHTTKSGITYCYSSVPKWDPVLKQARPEKTYLGRWDEETQSIIPTTGKRGRKKKEDPGMGTCRDSGADPGPELLELREKLGRLQKELEETKEEVSRLSRKNQEYMSAITAARNALKQAN